MRRLGGLLLSVVLSLGLGTLAAGDTSAPPDKSSLPIRIHAITRDITVAPDGSSVTIMHSEVQILTDAMIPQLAQEPVGYDGSLQDLDVVEAYTLKTDGRKIPVTPEAIITRQGTTQNSMSLLFDDTRQKVIIFPNVEVGDTLVFTTRLRSRPIIPGQFAYDIEIPSTLVFDLTSVSVTAQAPLDLNVDAKGLKVEHRNGVYSVRFSNTTPVSDSDQPVSRFDRGPRFSVSTFKDYDALARADDVLVRPTLTVTPQIQAKADEITAGVGDRREQARRIYDWVSRHVRYVAIEFGAGGIVPHAPDSVLTNAYGDCKDHAALFLALLKAKGIDGNAVLINGRDSYTVAAVPTFGAFNHMIAWLPEFALYADTTSGQAAFGTLPNAEYGKPVVVLGVERDALRHIAPRGSNDAGLRVETKATIGDDSRLSLDTTTTGTGTFATMLRGLSQGLGASGWTRLAGEILKTRHMDKATGDFQAVSTNDLSDSFDLKGKIATLDRPHLLSGEDFEVPADFSPLVPNGTLFFGPVADGRAKDDNGVPCYGGKRVDDYALSFPATKKLQRVPDDVSVHTSYFTFTSHWTVSGNTLNVHRELAADFGRPVCTASMHRDVLDALRRVQEDFHARIALVSAS